MATRLHGSARVASWRLRAVVIYEPIDPCSRAIRYLSQV